MVPNLIILMMVMSSFKSDHPFYLYVDSINTNSNHMEITWWPFQAMTPRHGAPPYDQVDQGWRADRHPWCCRIAGSVPPRPSIGRLDTTWSGWGLSPTPLKNMNSSIGMIIPNIWENQKCSKPPTSDMTGDLRWPENPMSWCHCHGTNTLGEFATMSNSSATRNSMTALRMEISSGSVYSRHKLHV